MTEEFKDLIGEIKSAKASWQEGGNSIVPVRPNTSLPRIPPIEDKPDAPWHNRDNLGLVIPRIYRQEDDDSGFQEEVVHINGAAYTEQVLVSGDPVPIV